MTKTRTYLDQRQVAERIGVTPEYVRALRMQGELPDPDVLVGRQPGWRETSIDRWWEKRPKRAPRAPLVHRDIQSVASEA